MDEGALMLVGVQVGITSRFAGFGVERIRARQQVGRAAF
jgi:hypothetical protein